MLSRARSRTRSRVLGLGLGFLLAAVFPSFAQPGTEALPVLAIPSLPGTIIHDIRPGAGVTAIRTLSDYAPSLAMSPADSLVYVFDSGLPGPAIFIAAGTHANEIAGIVAATLIVEHAQPAAGKLFVLPHANNSGSTYRDPARPGPDWVALDGASGRRYFAYGARLLHPLHQGQPDPEVFLHSPGMSGQSGSESRNLDRAYPGAPSGTLTARLADGIMQLLSREKIDLAFDLHEAGPTSSLVWTVVANPKNLEVAALALLDLDEDGIRMKLDASQEGFRGLSHYEWGNLAQASAFLVETPNPGQVSLSALAIDQVAHPVYPLWKRVAVQIETVRAIVASALGEDREARPALFPGLPTWTEFLAAGLRPWF